MMVVTRVSLEQTALHYISVLYLAAMEFQLWNQLDLAYCLHVSVLHLRETEVLYLTSYTVVLYQIQYECKFTYLHFLKTQHCFLRPDPPNFRISWQFEHWPQSLFSLQPLHDPHWDLFLLSVMWMVTCQHEWYVYYVLYKYLYLRSVID